MRKIFSLLVLCVLILSSCSDISEEGSNENIVKGNKIYSISKEKLFLKESNTSTSNNIINQKLTDTLGEKSYITIDSTVDLSIKEEKDGWVKVQVVQPEHLSKTHIGWIEKVNIQEKIEENKKPFDEGTAKVQCKKSVKNLLNHPKTANFSSLKVSYPGVRQSEAVINGKIEGKNSFGVPIEKYFNCVFTYDKDTGKYNYTYKIVE